MSGVVFYDPDGPCAPVAYSFWYELGDDGSVARVRHLDLELENEDAPPRLDERQLHQQPTAATVRLHELVREFLQLLGRMVRCVSAIGKCGLCIPRDHLNSIKLRHRRSFSCGDSKRLDVPRERAPGAVSPVEPTEPEQAAS